MVNITFNKTHEDAKLPTKNHQDDSGWDVYAVEETVVPGRGSKTVPVGLTLGDLSEGYWIQVYSRSGLSFKSSILAHPGVIDCSYRGDLGVLLYNHSDNDYIVKKGDRVAQLVVHKNYVSEVKWGEVTETKRGEKGFGSSGR